MMYNEEWSSVDWEFVLQLERNEEIKVIKK